MHSAESSQNAPSSKRRHRRPLLLRIIAFDVLAGLALLLTRLVAVPIAMRTIRAIELGADVVIGGFFRAVATAVQNAGQEAFSAVEASDAVKQRLGEPLVLPGIEEVVFPEQPAAAPSGELEFQFFVSGPLGKANVSATAKAEDDKLSIVRLTVAPIDGTEPIVVRPAND